MNVAYKKNPYGPDDSDYEQKKSNRNTVNYILLILVLFAAGMIGFLVYHLTGIILNALVTILLVISILSVIWQTIVSTSNSRLENYRLRQTILLNRIRNEELIDELKKEFVLDLERGSSLARINEEIGFAIPRIHIEYRNLYCEELAKYLFSIHTIHNMVYAIINTQIDRSENLRGSPRLLLRAEKLLKVNSRDKLLIHEISTGNSIDIYPSNRWIPYAAFKDGKPAIYVHPKFMPVILTITILAAVAKVGTSFYKDYLEIQVLRKEVYNQKEIGQISKDEAQESIAVLDNFEKSIKNLRKSDESELDDTLRDYEKIMIENDQIQSIEYFLLNKRNLNKSN